MSDPTILRTQIKKILMVTNHSAKDVSFINLIFLRSFSYYTITALVITISLF